MAALASGRSTSSATSSPAASGVGPPRCRRARRAVVRRQLVGIELVGVGVVPPGDATVLLVVGHGLVAASAHER